MKDSQISTRSRIQTKQKNHSISSIEHQQLKVQFSLSSIFPTQDHQNGLLKTNRLISLDRQEQIRQQYAQSYNPNSKKLKIVTEQQISSNKRKVFQNITNKTKGQYFQDGEFFTPKINKHQTSTSKTKVRDKSTKSNKQRKQSLNSANSKKLTTTKKSSSNKLFSSYNVNKSTTKLKNQKSQKSHKNQKSFKKFNQLKNIKLKVIQSSSQKQIENKPFRGKDKLSQLKSCKQIFVICHQKGDIKKLKNNDKRNQKNIGFNNKRVKQINDQSRQIKKLKSTQLIRMRSNESKNLIKINDRKLEKQQKSNKQNKIQIGSYWNQGLNSMDKYKQKKTLKNLKNNSNHLNSNKLIR